MNKTFKILEIIWLVLGCIGIAQSTYFIITKDYLHAIYFFIFTLVCGLMYAIRKHQRKQFEDSDKQNK